MPASDAAATLLQASPPPEIGSNACAVVGSPPPELTVCAAAAPKVTAPGCSSGQLAAR